MPKIAEIESTPNPNAKKFVLKEPLSYGLTRSFDNATQAANDPLADKLFSIPHVSNVFYVDRWITVTQDGGADWPDLLKRIAAPIRAAPAAIATSIDSNYAKAARPNLDLSPEDEARLAKINSLLDERVRPALMSDGGDIEVWGLSGNQLQIHYQGACGSCPTSLAGTLGAVENLLRTIEPELELVPV